MQFKLLSLSDLLINDVQILLFALNHLWATLLDTNSLI